MCTAASLLLIISIASILCDLTATGGFSHVDITLVADEVRLKQGESKLNELRQYTESPRYGDCWTNALNLLDTSCAHLTEEIQRRLAIEFTYCFLLIAGRETERCEHDDRSADCTKRMNSEQFNVYTEFFTHTQSICYYLQATVWQERTEMTIEHLVDNSAVVARQLEDSSELQTELLHRQNVSLLNQQVLINSGEELQQKLEHSKNDVRLIMSELQRATMEQQHLLSDVFNRINSLQSIVMGEFTGFYSLIFYAVAILIAYLLTSTPRTSSSRFVLFVVLTVNMATEWLLAKWCSESFNTDSAVGQSIDENTLVFTRIKLCRKCFMTLAVTIWAWMAYRYEDLNRINNKLLVDIKKQNAELKSLLLPDSADGSQCKNVDLVGSVTARSKTAVSSETTTEGYGSQNETGTDIDLVGRDKSVGIDENLGNTRGIAQAVGDYLKGVQNSVSKDHPPDYSLSNLSTSSLDSFQSNQQQSTKKGRLSLKNEANTSTPSSNRYNLRSRTNTPDTSPVNEQAAIEIGKEAKRLWSVSSRNKVKTLRTLEQRRSQLMYDDY